MILRANLLEGEDGSGLLVDDCAETRLALYDNVGDTHLATEGREEDDKLNGVNVISDDNEGSLLGLDEGDRVVQTVLNKVWLLVRLLLLTLGSGGSSGSETGLLLLLRLRAVLVQELEQLCSGVLVQSVGELGDGWWDLQALVKDDLLALEADVFGPLDEAGEVALGLDILADTEVAAARLEERVLQPLARCCHFS